MVTLNICRSDCAVTTHRLRLHLKKGSRNSQLHQIVDLVEIQWAR
jgi:hypothetical protein